MTCRCCFDLAGALAATLLAMSGCASDPPPQPSTPTFESRVGEATPRVDPLPTPAPTPAEADPLIGGPGAGSDMTTPPTTPSGPSERELCDALLLDAKLHTEDIQGGVALVITPKVGGDLEALKQAARTIESRMPPAGMTTPPANTGSSGTIAPSGTSPGGTTGTTTGAGATGTTGNAASPGSASASDVPAADACPLFDLGRRGARASVAEQQKGVRLLLTASDPASVKPLRVRAREWVKTTTQGSKTPKASGTPAPARP